MEGLVSSRWIISIGSDVDSAEFEAFLLGPAFTATERETLTRVTRSSMQSLSKASAGHGGTNYLWGLHLDLMNSAATERIISETEAEMRTQLEPWGAFLSSLLVGALTDESAEDS